MACRTVASSGCAKSIVLQSAPTYGLDSLGFKVDTFDDLDVVDSHVYTVQGTFERDGETYVRLYNPWGHNHAELTIDEFRQVFDEVDAPHFYYDPPPPGGWQTPEPEMV